MKNVLKVLLIMVLTMAFAFSCSNSDENPFAESYLYCVNSVAKTCVPGVFKECPSGAVPKDVCPAEFAEKASSSSSRGSSSSGVGDNDPFADIYGWEYYKETLKYYDPDDGDQRCRNGVVEERCEVDGNEVWFNPLTHSCSRDDCPPDSDNCDPPRFGAIEHCGIFLYANLDDGIICERCGSGYYLRSIHYDGYDGIMCQNGIVEGNCDDDIWYNIETHYCDWSTGTAKAIEHCGNWYIYWDEQRCNNGVVEEECNATWYNPITQSCDWGTSTVKAKQRCGS